MNNEKLSGNYKVEFNATKLSSGIYFYRMQTGNFTETKKLTLFKIDTVFYNRKYFKAVDGQLFYVN
ncbi:MAG: T9SS type A sorting domain-containing protein [Bacteroidetes bacterium]|nr:T9SS type A sorting domain-containing protein [Bacteroidota bacterium]